MSSFQGPGTGITGTSNQFQVGYAQGTGYTYGNIGGAIPQAGYANQGAATSANLQLISAGGSSWGWQGQASNPSHLWGSNQGTVNTVFNPAALQVSYAGYAGSTGNVNGYAPQAGYANQAAAAAQTVQVQGVGNNLFGWQGQQSNPSWLWGSNQGNVETVFSPGALQVSYAGYSGSAGNANGYVPQAGYANQAVGNVQGYAPQAGYANQATRTTQRLQLQGTNSTWIWSGQGGIPNHYWGSNDGVNHYVWQANQGYAGYSGSAANANGSGPSAGYASYAATSYQYNFINSAGNASYGATAQILQLAFGHPRAWRGNWNGAAGGISQYQGGSYGYVHIEFATNCQAGACGYSMTSANFSAFGNNLQTNQVGPGVIMWN